MEITTFLFFSFLLSSASGIHGSTPDPPLQTYIVLVHPSDQSTVFSTTSGDRHSYYKSFLPPTIQSSGVPPRMIRMYDHILSGFAARLTEKEVTTMSTIPGFGFAYPDSFCSLHTTHTPTFLGLDLNKGIWNQSNSGEGVIIGVLDTGISPSHPSFSDHNMPPPPAKWKGRCDFNNASICNNKLIGARNFVGAGNGSAEASAPLDIDGHGTHTASTAAGSAVAGAEVFGNANGTAVGMAPRAHLAVYKVCTETKCMNSDILAAMDAAVEDGVDILSLSLGSAGIPTYFYDLIAVGAFGAMKNGVFVSCSAGNDGPNASSLENEAPWILTVAASTMDRRIQTTVKLPDGIELSGESLFQTPVPSFLPIVYAGASGKPNASFCGNGSLNGVDVRSKIVLCHRGGGVGRIQKGEIVKEAGGAGMILANESPDAYSTLADAHVLPSSHISFMDGRKLHSYMKSTPNPKAAIVSKGTVLGSTPNRAPEITSFSSRGPSLRSPGILKPDITGPGVGIVAAWPFAVGDSSFNVMSGTSMSCPHLSGIAALIKSAHPYWSPAAIKSAIMTTADVVDNRGMRIQDEKLVVASLFATGAGHVNPNRATDPGLVYDIAADDYIPYLCGLGYNTTHVSAIVSRAVDCRERIEEWELNYPSFTAAVGGAAAGTSVTVGRTVRNVGEARSSYRAHVEVPGGVSVKVSPRRLVFTRVNQERRFNLTITVDGGDLSSHGYFSWVSEKHTVRSPISVITFKK